MRTSLWDKVYSMPRRRAVRFVVAMAILAPVWNEKKMMSNIYSFRRSVPQSLPPLWMQHRRLFQHFVQQGCLPIGGVTICKPINFQSGFHTHVIPSEYILNQFVTSPVKKQPAGREAPCLPLPAPQSLAQRTPRPWEARHPREAPLASPQESPKNWFDIIHLSSGHLQAWIEIWEKLWSCKQFLQVGIGWGHQEVKVPQGGLCSRPLNILLLWMGSI